MIALLNSFAFPLVILAGLFLKLDVEIAILLAVIVQIILLFYRIQRLPSAFASITLFLVITDFLAPSVVLFFDGSLLLVVLADSLTTALLLIYVILLDVSGRNPTLWAYSLSIKGLQAGPNSPYWTNFKQNEWRARLAVYALLVMVFTFSLVGLYIYAEDASSPGALARRFAEFKIIQRGVTIPTAVLVYGLGVLALLLSAARSAQKPWSDLMKDTLPNVNASTLAGKQQNSRKPRSES